jgi:ABC-type sulfate transport system permease subunit
MIDYDLANYMSSIMSNFLSGITIYFSIVTAYVIAAFVAGGRLTTFQLIVVNLSFTIAAGIVGVLAILTFNRFFELGQRLQDSEGTPLIDFTYVLGLLVVVLYLGSLTFMWSIRRNADDV